MKIRILGGGWFGCTIAKWLADDHGHEVELHEAQDRLFAGASGANPARLHLGFHYPRSGLTQAACQDHHARFMSHLGFLTRGVPINLYAVTAEESFVDFAQYKEAFRGKVEFVEVVPSDHGLQNVEGALLTGERHIVIREARKWFTEQLAGVVRFGSKPTHVDDSAYDWTIDCTFCANDEENIDRFEPCVTGILEGPSSKAVTIMDGPFGSVYPWDEVQDYSSITSAKYTPLSKTCRTYAEAKAMLDGASTQVIETQIDMMVMQMANYWPSVFDYKIVDAKLGVRAMPRSYADSRLVDVVKVGERALRVRAGKIDAVFHATDIVAGIIDRSRK